MAEQKPKYPMIPVAHWWNLRRKFKQSIPGVVSATYVASALDMQENSARANVLPFLRKFGLIDEEGKTLDRARQWRDDHDYPNVCKEIREEIYPDELRDVAPNPNEDARPASRWFASHTGAGEAAVRKMVSVYALLMQADPASEPQQKTPNSSPRKKKPGETKLSPTAATKQTQAPRDEPDQREVAAIEGGRQQLPDVNINLQVHISSDATPDQIDKILESMAKHLYGKR